MVSYRGQHCVIVAEYNAYTVEINLRNGPPKRVYWTDLRETTAGEIRAQKRAAREGRADNSELWPALSLTKEEVE